MLQYPFLLPSGSLLVWINFQGIFWNDEAEYKDDGNKNQSYTTISLWL